MTPVLALLAFSCALPSPVQEPATRGSDVAALLSGLALRDGEHEERLAVALARAMTGDCEVALERLEAIEGADGPLAARLATERDRLRAWIGLRDAFLAELEASGKPLGVEVAGRKIAVPFKREGDELVLARGTPARVSVRALAPEALIAAIPKERLAPGEEWLRLYPCCLTGNPKWKRLTVAGEAAERLRADATEFYPSLARLAPVAGALERLAGRAPPGRAEEARELRAELAPLLADAHACLRARRAALVALVTHCLELEAAALGVSDFVHGTVTAPAAGPPRIAYDFGSETQRADWVRDEDYLDGLREQLEPVRAPATAPPFDLGPTGFRGNGEFCWRHVLEFRAPLRVRYKVRWEPFEGSAGKVFAFGVGLLADRAERHVRAMELGFLYVDERDGRYTAVRPEGDATVTLGRTYALELVHDGAKAEVWVDGALRAQAAAPGRAEGRVFLWGHSDLLVSVPSIEIEGQATEESLAARRGEWVRAHLAELGVEQEK